MGYLKKVYVLRNKKRGEAFLPGKDTDMDFTVGLMQQKRLSVNTLKLCYTSISERNLILPEINEEWLADAELLRIEAVPIGEFSRPLRIENFSFQKGAVSLGSMKKGPDEKALGRIKLPENPTKE